MKKPTNRIDRLTLAPNEQPRFVPGRGGESQKPPRIAAVLGFYDAHPANPPNEKANHAVVCGLKVQLEDSNDDFFRLLTLARGDLLLDGR